MNIQHVTSAKLYWREDGARDGAPVVFANSLGTDLRIWDSVVEQLPVGLRIIRFDNRGHGLSSCPDAPYSLDDLTRDTAELLDQLEVAHCTFVGLSIGGMIGQRLAHLRPDLVSRLVLSNTAAKMGDSALWTDRIAAIQSSGIEALADPILERWFSAKFRETDEVEAWRNMLIRTPKTGYLGCCHALARADLTQQTAGLRLPTLAIAGSQDGASPASIVEATARLIPNARFEMIDGAGHLPCVETPALFTALLIEFLKEAENDG